MNKGICGILGDFLMEWVVLLPVSATAKHPKPIRIIGLLVYFVWFLPAILVCLLPLMALLVGEMFEEV